MISKKDLKFQLSPAVEATRLKPGFFHHYLIDVDNDKAEELDRLLGPNDTVSVIPGDCNRVMLDKLIPLLDRYQPYRAMVLIDPYKMTVDWEVVRRLGQTGRVDMFLNFPVMHMNRSVLLRKGGTVSRQQMEVMDRWWGDRSWFAEVFGAGKQPDMFGKFGFNKSDSNAVVRAYRKRLENVGGYKFVPQPVPMLNSNNAIIYWLFFASNNRVASNIATDIFNSYRRKAS